MSGRHAIQEGHQLRRIVTVGTGQDDIERDAVAIDEEVMLAARLAPISRVGTSFFPHSRPAPMKNRRSRAKNRGGGHCAVWPTGCGTVCPRRQPVANRGHEASNSSRNRTPFPWAAFPKAGRIAG